jgi:quinol monooxygenase YgiN
MIIRIVKLSFQENKSQIFIDLFNERKQAIRHVEGCLHLELWREENNPDIVFTYSHWENGEALDKYRFSDFFRDTWSKTKPYFKEKAQAWSLVREEVVDSTAPKSTFTDPV